MRKNESKNLTKSSLIGASLMISYPSFELPLCLWRDVVWCLIKRRKVTAQFSNFENTQNLYIANLIYVSFFLLIPKFSGVLSNSDFLTALFLVLSYAPFLILSVYLSLPPTYAPLYFYLLPFQINTLMIFISSIIE